MIFDPAKLRRTSTVELTPGAIYVRFGPDAKPRIGLVVGTEGKNNRVIDLTTGEWSAVLEEEDCIPLQLIGPPAIDIDDAATTTSAWDVGTLIVGDDDVFVVAQVNEAQRRFLSFKTWKLSPFHEGQPGLRLSNWKLVGQTSPTEIMVLNQPSQLSYWKKLGSEP